MHRIRMTTSRLQILGSALLMSATAYYAGKTSMDGPAALLGFVALLALLDGLVVEGFLHLVESMMRDLDKEDAEIEAELAGDADLDIDPTTETVRRAARAGGGDVQ